MATELHVRGSVAGVQGDAGRKHWPEKGGTLKQKNFT
jgi:hypothetical protein